MPEERQGATADFRRRHGRTSAAATRAWRDNEAVTPAAPALGSKPALTNW